MTRPRKEKNKSDNCHDDLDYPDQTILPYAKENVCNRYVFDLFTAQKLRIWSHLLNKSLMENFNFCVVVLTQITTNLHMKNENATSIQELGTKEAKIVISSKNSRNNDKLLSFVKKGL